MFIINENIIVKDSEIKRLQEYVEKQAIDIIYNEQIVKDMHSLKQIASEYIKLLEDELSDMDELKRIDIHRKSLRASYRKQNISTKGFMTQPEYEKYTKQRQEILKKMNFEKLIVETEKFQKKIFEIMNKKIQTVFVDIEIDSKGREHPLLYEMNAADLFTVNASEFGKFGAKTISSISNIQKILINENLEDDKEYDTLVETYNNYIERRKMSKNNYVMVYNALVSKSVIGVYNTKWTVQKTGQLGDIKEAFSSMFFSMRYKSLIPKNEETNLYLFMKEIAMVDATAGALEGDVVLDKIEYSIKSAGAGYQSIYPFYKIAKILEKDITNNPKILEVIGEIFKKPPRNKMMDRNGIGNFLRSKVDKEAREYYEKLVKELEKI